LYLLEKGFLLVKKRRGEIMGSRRAGCKRTTIL